MERQQAAYSDNIVDTVITLRCQYCSVIYNPTITSNIDCHVMPMSSSGQYTPLSQAERDLIGAYIGGVLRHEPGLTPLQAGIRIGTRFDIDNSDTFVIYGIIRDERAANAAAAAADRDQGYRPLPTDLPSLPDDPANRGLIVTRYVVTIRDPATGDVTTSQEEHLSHDPVSINDILAEVDADRESYLRRIGTQPAAVADASRLEISIIILSIGRAA
jgi:hypothetical protein